MAGYIRITLENSLGINTFLDQLDEVLACAREGEIHEPARAFHARLRHIKDQLDKRGGAK